MVYGKGYREKIYILKDVILTLSEYGTLNQTALISYCGLNLKKHRNILDSLEENGMVTRFEEKAGKRTVTMYKATQKGLEFCKAILDPYEELFPRKSKNQEDDKTNLSLLILV
ncbi:MAG: winged helix-turn-helix domain-containing protein [Nitrososphaerota archaeon]